MEENRPPTNRKSDLIVGRVIAGIFALIIFFVAYEKASLNNYSNNQTVRLLLGLVSALLVFLAYTFFEFLLNLWQKIISRLLLIFGKLPSVRTWVVLPIIVISALYPLYNLRQWNIEVTLIVLIIAYLVFLLPAALLSLLRDDMRFEKTQLGKEISRNIQAQNPQAAIGHAFTYFENRLRERIPNSTNLYGRKLIQSAFGGNNSHLVYISTCAKITSVF